MAGWETTSKATEFNVANTFQEAINNRKREDVIVNDSLKLDPFGDDSVVGINAKQIPPIQNELEEYIGEIETVLQNFESNVNAKIGVAGEDINTAIREYFTKVKQYLLDLVTNFRAFNDKLSAVNEAYVKFQSSEASTVQASAGKITSNTYVEKYASTDGGSGTSGGGMRAQ